MCIGHAGALIDGLNLDALTAASCERIFADRISGSVRCRSALGKLLDHLLDADG